MSQGIALSTQEIDCTCAYGVIATFEPLADWIRVFRPERWIVHSRALGGVPRPNPLSIDELIAGLGNLERMVAFRGRSTLQVRRRSGHLAWSLWFESDQGDQGATALPPGKVGQLASRKLTRRERQIFERCADGKSQPVNAAEYFDGAQRKWWRLNDE
jgi:hypothetical protein